MVDNDMDIYEDPDYIDTFERSSEHENFIRSLFAEDRIMEETSPFPEDAADPAEAETPERTLLKRDIRKAAIARMEDAARTVSDFQEVVKAWDREDANRERRERYHEIGRDSVPLEYNMTPDGAVIPLPIHHVYWQQMLKGDFFDVIFDCPYELHELVSDPDLSRILNELSIRHKELFFYLAVRNYTTATIAKLYGQSDRNIRRVRTTILKTIHNKLLPLLREKEKAKQPLTIQERDYLKNYCEQQK